MILKYLSALWTAFAPTVGNHLWQSTIFVIMVWSLTLILQKNHARARYWLWLSASVKFLVPFSLLVGLGSHLSWSRGSAGTKAGLYLAMEEFSQPFAQPTMSMVSRATPATLSSTLFHLLPALLVTTWFCGFMVVILIGFSRWRRISAAVGESAPLREGREVNALRRVELVARMPKRIELLLSHTSMEPGIFGILRPVLVWPHGVSERLGDAHLEAIFAHELCHVRRRDNLASAMHMFVEAIFWFHPLVWWLGARLVEERERGCDEEVLASGSDRQVYAECILKICEFCVESPLACVAGVTGADLKKRVARIMTECVVRNLDFSRKLVLSTAGLIAVFVPTVFGLLNPTQTRAASQGQDTTATAGGFETATIQLSKPSDPKLRYAYLTDKFTGTNNTLQMIIRAAYGVEDPQISGGPSWLNSEKFDIELKMSKSTAGKLQNLSDDERFLEWRHMVQVFLVDRFKLKLHRETKEVPGYALVLAKNGPTLHEAKLGDTYPNGLSDPSGKKIGAGTMHTGIGELTVQGLSMEVVARLLTQQLGRAVVDKSGLTGSYDFTLRWTPDETQPPPFRGAAAGQQGTGSTPPLKSSGPSIYTAIQEQLGLKLEPQGVPMETLVIDHAEQPSAN